VSVGTLRYSFLMVGEMFRLARKLVFLARKFFPQAGRKIFPAYFFFPLARRKKKLAREKKTQGTVFRGRAGKF